MGLLDRLQKVTTFFLDIDGVLTDGSVLVLENGLQARAMNVRDGFGIQYAVSKGYRIIVISGGAVSPVVDRMRYLGVMDINMGVKDKYAMVQEKMVEYNLVKEETLFMGDDIPDLLAFPAVGISACPSDAVGEILAVADYISPVKGGEGCVREIIGKILKMNGDWDFELSVDLSIASK